MRSMEIASLLDMIERREFVLPALQRPFVWQEEKVARLMDSLLRRFHLGTILIWRTDNAKHYRMFAKDVVAGEEASADSIAADNETQYYVLDGYHRLASLYIACCGTLDGRRLYLDTLGDAASGSEPSDMRYEFRFLTDEEADVLNAPVHSGAAGPYFVPFGHFWQDQRFGSFRCLDRAMALMRELKLDFARFERIQFNFFAATRVFGEGEPFHVHIADWKSLSGMPLAEAIEMLARYSAGGLAPLKSELLMGLPAE